METGLKKFLLTSFVVVSFAGYSYNQRHPEGESSTTTTPSSPSANPSTSPPAQSMGMMGLKDGQYTGDVADAFYGLIQVKAIISSGKITGVQFLQYPNDRSNSIYINKQAMPLLKEEAISAQSSQVDIISGATDTSMAFIQSLNSALSQARM